MRPIIFLSALLATTGLARGQEAPETLSADLIAAHNRERQAQKLPPLVASPKLTEAALAHAKDMAARATMSHEGGDGSAPADRIKRTGYKFRTLGENVAAGQRSVASVMESWMDSPPHKKNILGDFAEIGVARADDADGKPYWCVDFGTPIAQLDPAVASAGLVDQMNKLREDAKLAPLSVDRTLSDSALEIAQAMAGKSSLPNDEAGGQAKATAVLDKLAKGRFRTLAELAAFGPPDAKDAVKSIQEGQDKANTFLGKFTKVGVGYANSPDGTPFWCVLLGKP